MASSVVPVILCGGSGSRLWPMSRRLLPKQFLPLVSDRTLFQDTALRTRGIANCGAPVVVTSAEQRFLAANQLADIAVAPRALLLEPTGRNTTPASGYGYIEAGERIAGNAFRILRFVEKPSLEKARTFLAQGGFYWNSGMFVFQARRYVEELGRLQPAILDAVRKALDKATADLAFLRLYKNAFSASPANSVDYAVMERTDAGAMVRASMRWSDVGSWSALWDAGDKDGAGNVSRGDVALRGASDCYVHAGSRHVSVLGADNLVVVETDDAVLVATKDRAQEVKDVVEQLSSSNRTEHVSHRRVHRPWGYYETTEAGSHFQVKRLMVKPGHKLSLQLHHKRAEHWVVVSGTARVTRGDGVLELGRNQSTYIPVETKHRLENPGSEPLLIVEVQSGAYLGEDDIVRYKDSYNRDSTSR